MKEKEGKIDTKKANVIVKKVKNKKKKADE